ncbi:2-aminoadipate transaminase isoform X1 [Hylaeus volcanicus]|uniref:2-aminoadipate transaminase isoform X1 n=2 Tax=Hylaeus volcanicus TaxID=313075 RepID=UPI0023B79E03|nr:2-aminoadipate transaminase isoform X1 [Hylaeus volcanicus]XP_053989999.1 2-aminoadipate transaminase isoform X1 [Hylaeus volcanicus]XP_053990000.1 2-aminoadipate transaminase isoform X1 [Hylaeus volcanicus]
MFNMETIDDPYLRHLFDGDDAFNVYKDNFTNLSVGAPGPDLLQHCTEMIQRATDHRLEEERKEGKYYLFQYGITAGLWECRKELAMFLTRQYGDPVSRENLILTCGASHGLQLLLNTIVSPNGIIFVEEVTYMIALDAFKQFPLMKIVTVPMKNDTVDVDAFEEIVTKEKKNGNFLLSDEKLFWAMFYTIPTFHNPTGRTLPLESCKRLIEIARNNSILVVCDDVYNLLYYGNGNPPHRLFFYDNLEDPNYKGGNIISNCSFSKILSPAIRFGWMECPAKIAKIFRSSGILRSGGAVNHYISGVITSLLHLKIEDKYLDYIINIYRERLSVLCNVLDQYLPKCCSYYRPEGGYFVWIHLPPGINANDFIKWCQEKHNISAIPGARFSYTGKCNNFLRLSIGFHNKEALKTASTTLCKVLLYYLENNTEYMKNLNN